MGFYWNIMMYECEVEYKGYFFSCFSIFNERYFTFTNSFKAFAPPPCELNLATPTRAAGSKDPVAFLFENPLPSIPPLKPGWSLANKVPGHGVNRVWVCLKAGFLRGRGTDR